MTEQPQETPDDLVHTQTFDAEGPLEIDVDINVGRVEIHLGGEAAEATVEIRHEPSAAAPWTDGVSTLLSWVGERFGGQLGTDLTGSPADAVTQTRVEKTGNRLVVRGPKPLPLRNVPLAVTVHAPEGSHPGVRTAAAEVTVTGRAGRADVGTGSGDVALEHAEGAATVRTGSGSVKLGPVAGGLQLRAGSGDVEVSSLPGSATVATGSGDVWLGEVSGEILVRTSSGDLSVADAASGSLEAITGSGEIRVAIRDGVVAEIDLSSGSGKVTSELDVADTAPEGTVPLTIRARSGSGDAVVAKAAS